MKYKFKLQEGNSPEIGIEKSFWLGNIKVYLLLGLLYFRFSVI